MNGQIGKFLFLISEFLISIAPPPVSITFTVVWLQSTIQSRKLMVTQFQNENKNITWAQDFPRHLSIWNCPQQMGNSNSEQWPSFLNKGKLGTYHDRALRTFLKRRRKRYTYITAAKALLYTGSRWQKHYKWVAPAKGKEHTKVEGESLKGCVEWINFSRSRLFRNLRLLLKESILKFCDMSNELG